MAGFGENEGEAYLPWAGKKVGLGQKGVSGDVGRRQRCEEQNVRRLHLAVLCRRNWTAKKQLDPIRRLWHKPTHALIKAVFVTVDIRYKGQRIKYFKRRINKPW